MLPRIEMIPNHHHFLTMEIIDFSNNHISYIKSGTFCNVASKELRLTQNLIESIEANAFSGSKFFKMYVILILIKFFFKF